MRPLEETTSSIENTKFPEVFKSFLLGFIFFILIAILILTVMFNLAVLHIAHLAAFVIFADVLLAVTAYFAVKVVYITLLNYNIQPGRELGASKENDLIAVPIIVFLLGLILLLFIWDRS